VIPPRGSRIVLDISVTAFSWTQISYTLIGLRRSLYQNKLAGTTLSSTLIWIWALGQYARHMEWIQTTEMVFDMIRNLIWYLGGTRHALSALSQDCIANSSPSPRFDSYDAVFVMYLLLALTCRNLLLFAFAFKVMFCFYWLPDTTRSLHLDAEASVLSSSRYFRFLPHENSGACSFLSYPILPLVLQGPLPSKLTLAI